VRIVSYVFRDKIAPLQIGVHGYRMSFSRSGTSLPQAYLQSALLRSEHALTAICYCGRRLVLAFHV